MSPGLRDYAAKRDFGRTPEPRGHGRAHPATGRGLIFVVQKHTARRPHYDLRLELDGTLKSWAVTRGPSLVPGEKRLAVRTEDHPLEYADFEGNIPEGEYGAGSVVIWDRGTWVPEGEAREKLAEGHITFELRGSKLKGRWHLVRMRSRPRERQESWLLIKSDDPAAQSLAGPVALEQPLASVKSRKSAKDAARESTAMPPFIEPCLARPADAPPTGDRWVHEIKFDGYRLQARKQGEKVELLTRKGLDWTDRFGGLANAFRAVPARSAIIDGELVVEDEGGATNFSALQAALKDGRFGDLQYYAFDLLLRDGRDLRELPLEVRKQQLEELVAALPAGGPIRLSEHFRTDGRLMLRHVCRMGLEGIVSKRADRPYRSGRGTDWIKTKCVGRQEFVIVGFSPSRTMRHAIGALALGQYDKDGLVYHGRVGTGFSADVAAMLFERLDRIRRASPPFPDLPASEKKRGLRWVEPQLVAEIEFRAWTRDGLVRHAVFRGLREDKPAQEVVTEQPASRGSKSSEPDWDETMLTHPDRLLWPDVGVTKLGLAQFYAEIWPWLGPHMLRRPLSLVRCPDGYPKPCFFQRHAWAGIDSSIRRIRLSGEAQDSLFVEDLEGLIALVQAAVLEIHPWGSRIDDVEHADRMVFDLDPGPEVQWADVIEAALEVREALRDHGLESFVKTTGGKGLHVVVPLRPAADWDAVKAFSRLVAEGMVRRRPTRYTATSAKRSRSRRIFIDYLRNERGATAVAPYSARARPGAPVSTPLGWEELSVDIGPAHFTVLNLPSRLRHLETDPWAGINEICQGLPTSAEVAKPSRRRS